MSYEFHIGDRVTWNWGSGTAEGTIDERFTSKVTKTIDGTEVTRNADDDNPAYLISQDDGAEVLKSASELDTA